MKDIVVSSHLNSFVESFGFQGLEEYEQFERFCFYALLNNVVNRSLLADDLDFISVGDNKGFDGISLVINGEIVKTLEDLEEIKKVNMEVSLYFIQSKTSPSFNDNDMANFLDSILDFLNKETTYPLTEEARNYHEMFWALFDSLSQIKKFRLHAFYCCTGNWSDETTIGITINNKYKEIDKKNYFNKIEIDPIDRVKIIEYYKKASNPIKAEFEFTNRVSMKGIDGVKEAYIGLISFSEFRRLIIDEDNDKIRNLFYDNVRDFLGLDNEVNEKIQDTLKEEKFAEFALFNNGITIISGDNLGRGDTFILDNYQIVNGCQTSNVLYECRDFDKINNVTIPLKVIITQDETLRDSIILSTNNQSRIAEEELLALTKFQKDLEEYYSTTPEEIFYERRDKQYANRPDVKKKSIVEIREQIKSFVAMFLDEPHEVSGHFGKVYRKKKERLFAQNHLFEPYYISGLIQFLFKEFLNSKEIERKYNKARYHVFMLFRMLNESQDFKTEFLIDSRKNKTYFENLSTIIRDKEKCLDSFKSIFKIIDDSGINITNQKEIYKKATTNTLINTYNKTYK